MAIIENTNGKRPTAGRWRVIVAALVLTIVGSMGVVFVAVSSNHGQAARIDQGVSEESLRELSRLPYCEVAATHGVPAGVLAGVVLAEKQLNRDWSDPIQDGLFRIALALRGEEGWRLWAQRASAAAQAGLSERARSADWSRDLIWTGFVFSLGPAQITPRTALRACANAAPKPDWCASADRTIRALLDETRSLHVAALVLRDEREIHLKATQVDLSGAPGRWATLYNFGGEIFRARFADRPDRPANGFGQWIERNQAAIRARLACT